MRGPRLAAPVLAGLAELPEGRRVPAGLGEDVAPVAEGAVAVGQARIVGAAGGGELLGGLDDPQGVRRGSEVAGVSGAVDLAPGVEAELLSRLGEVLRQIG